MSVPPDVAALAVAVQTQTDQVRQFKDEQLNLLTTTQPKADITGAEGNIVEVPSWAGIAQQVQAGVYSANGLFPSVAAALDPVTGVADGKVFLLVTGQGLQPYQRTGATGTALGDIIPGKAIFDATGIGSTGIDAIDPLGRKILWFLSGSNFQSNMYQTEDGEITLGDWVSGRVPTAEDIVAQLWNVTTGRSSLAITARGGAMIGNSKIELFDDADGIDGLVFIDRKGMAYAASPGYPDTRIPTLMGSMPSTGVVHEGIKICRYMAVIHNGQSNSTAIGGQPAFSKTQPYGNITFGGGVSPHPNTTDMDTVGPLIDSDTGYEAGSGESGLTVLCDSLVAHEIEVTGQRWQDQRTRYFAYCGGRGGKPIGYFIYSQSYPAGWNEWFVKFQKCGDRLHELAAAEQDTCAVLCNTWQQGEAEMGTYLGVPASSRADHALKLVTLEGQLWTMGCNVVFPEQTWRPLFLIGQLSSFNKTGPGDAGWCNPYITMAQLDVSRSHFNIRISDPGYIYDYWDDLHLNNVSHARRGRYQARAIRQLVEDRLAARPLRNPSLDMVSATWTSRRIDIHFNVPVAPLVFDTDWVTAARNMGFALRNAATNELLKAADGSDLIASVTIQGPTTVVITTTEAIPASNVKLTYAWGDERDDVPGVGRRKGARGNLRDSAGLKDFYVSEVDPSVTFYQHNWALHSELVRI